MDEEHDERSMLLRWETDGEHRSMGATRWALERGRLRVVVYNKPSSGGAREVVFRFSRWSKIFRMILGSVKKEKPSVAKRSEKKNEPDYPPEKAIGLLRTQLNRLQEFKGKHFRDVEHEESKWTDRTENIVSRSFGDPSRQLSRFHSALHAGIQTMMGISDSQKQKNFEQRFKEFHAVLENCIEELEDELPAASQGVYEAGEEFKFFADLAAIVGAAQREVLIVDPYLDEEHLSLYGGRIANGVKFRALTNTAGRTGIRSSLESVGRKLKKSQPSFEMKESSNIHDRMIFVDDRAWVTGQSIKDAAKTKPTYIVELNDPTPMRSVYEALWSSGQGIV